MLTHVRMRTKLLLVALVAVLLPLAVPAHADLPGPTDGGRAIILASETETIAEGIERSRYERLEVEGRNVINVLKVDLGSTDVNYLDTGVVAGVDIVSNMAARGDVDAAVNGDFFDINNSGAVAGTGVQLGEVIKSPNVDHQEAAVVTTDGIGAITSLILDGEISVNDGAPRAVAGLNMQVLPEGSVGVYDHQWGTYTLTRPLRDPADYHVVRVSGGQVTGVGEELGESVEIAEGEQLIVANGADAVAELEDIVAGDSVAVSIGVTEDVDNIAAAIGGNWSNIVVDGEPIEEPDPENPLGAVHPRTAIGFGDGGGTMYLVTVDGRQDGSRGMSFPELGRLMAELGATEAMNLDGGGSTTMISRDPGDAGTTVDNTPSDGQEREDGNALGVTSRASDGVLSGIAIKPVGVEHQAHRIFPGLTRTLAAQGHDAGGRAVDADVTWSSSDESVATVDADGNLTGMGPGRAEIIARSGDVESRWGVHVLTSLQYITVDPTVLQISGPGEEHELNVVGSDEQGYTAPINPTDISVSGADALTMEGSDAATFAVSANAAEASGVATVTVGEASAEFSFLVGTDELLITDLSEDIEDFTVDGARSTQSIEKRPGEGRDGSDAVALTVDFSQDGATRTANFKPVEDTEANRLIEGTAVELRVWVKGDGVNQPMLYALVNNEAGQVPVVYNPEIEATEEWQQVIVKLPQGFSGPFRWENFALYETAADKLYETTVLIDSIELVVAPNAEAPEFVKRTDPWAIADAGEAAERETRIAVMSDAQFVGSDPDSEMVAGARRSLQEMVAAQPDAIYILGDFTDEGNDDDFELAQRIIDEEIEPSGIPWTYVPGNHEIMGQPIENFVEHFGDRQTIKNYGSTRVITLDSAPYELGYDFEQIQLLRNELDAAAEDDSVTGVVVMFHHPTRDFLPSGNSGLRDPAEAAMIEEWLARFNETSGKQVALIGAGVGAFHARQQDNVLHVINGNSGKAATSSVDWGGFRGWTMLGIDPAEGPRVTDWMRVETRPWVDEGTLSIDAPETAEPGQTIDLDAHFIQEGFEIPVRWPVSAKWGGEGIFIGDPADAPADAVAVFNPETRQITFADDAEGDITLTLMINGEETSHTFRLPVGDDDPGDDDENPGDDETPGDGDEGGSDPGDDPTDGAPGDGDQGDDAPGKDDKPRPGLPETGAESPWTMTGPLLVLLIGLAMRRKAHR